MKSISRLISSLFPVVLMLSLLFSPTSASALLGVSLEGIADIGGMVTDAAEELENRYHLDVTSIQDYGEGFNVSANKMNVPEVSINFSPSDPREGEKLTARAFPIFFSNTVDQLYYTWYLKRDGCDVGVSLTEENEFCDADGDGDVTENDWIVSAMRIIVTDGADSAAYDYGRDTDADGYRAEYGGEMEVGTSRDWCYEYDASDGELYELEECLHVFADPGTTGTTGDGSFGRSEERFWGSNPSDPDTADNGNKDEANAVGVGRDTFTWNYRAGDQVGLLVEGTSMIPTKHDDSSFMIMWALSGNERCPIRNTGSYTENIKGYNVDFKTIDIERDDFLENCLESNLIDPIEGGQGRSKKLELSVTATPQNPINDQAETLAGDVVMIQASVNNAARSSNEMKYSWSVWLSDNPVDDFREVTGELRDAGLVSTTEGNGIDMLRVALNMDEDFLDAVDGISAGVDPIYMKVAVEAQENFSGLVAREGRSDVIVRISNTDKKIVAYTADVSLVSGTPKLELGSAPICNEYHSQPLSATEAAENLDRIACRLSRNEIIGLRVDPEGLSDFSWSINGIPLLCTEAVSEEASCARGNEVFFAAAGSPGETYSIRMDAVDVDTGKSVSLSRSFQIVRPEIRIGTADESQVWPRYVGSFTELGGYTVDEYSDEVFETYEGGSITLLARTIPGHVARRISSAGSTTWEIDGNRVEGDVYDAGLNAFILRYDPTYPKQSDEAYLVSFVGTDVFSDEHRLALDSIFGIDVLQSSDTSLQQDVRIKVVGGEEYASATEGDNRFFATVSRYVPPFVLLAFRMFATGALILFTVGFVFSLMPDTSNIRPERRRYDT